MKNVLTSAHLSAVEVVKPESMMKVDRDTGRPLKEWIDAQRQKASAELQALAWVQGSDAHALAEFGKRFTYVKMTTPSFSGVRAALLSPSSRLRIGADGDPTSRGRYLYGVALKGEWSGERFIRFNRHLNCVVGRKECGKSRLFDLIRKAAWGGADTPGAVRLFVDRRDEERSQLFCFEADEAGSGQPRPAPGGRGPRHARAHRARRARVGRAPPALLRRQGGQRADRVARRQVAGVPLQVPRRPDRRARRGGQQAVRPAGLPLEGPVAAAGLRSCRAGAGARA
jgi:hypothetical protein